MVIVPRSEESAFAHDELIPYSKLRRLADEELDERYARAILAGDERPIRYYGVEVERRVRDQGRTLARTAIIRAEKAIQLALFASLAAATASVAAAILVYLLRHPPAVL